MSLKQFSVIPFLVAALAFVMVVVDQLIQGHLPIPNNKGFGWVAFIAWSLYFAEGGTVQGGRKILYAYLYGISAAIAIVAGAVFLTEHIGFFASPVAIFTGVVVSVFFERLPPVDNVPVIFISAATFFALMTYVPGATYVSAAITELFYCVFGLVFGWLAVLARTKYESTLDI